MANLSVPYVASDSDYSRLLGYVGRLADILEALCNDTGAVTAASSNRRKRETPIQSVPKVKTGPIARLAKAIVKLSTKAMTLVANLESG